MKTKAPAYQMIYNIILKKINKGEYAKDMPVPSENELAQKHNVSRMTARKSVDMLVNEGYLVRHKGKGTFVTGRKNIKKETISLTQRMRNKGFRVYNEVKSFNLEQEVPDKIKEIFGENNDYTVVLERTRYLNDKPCIFETCYIPSKYVETATDELFTVSLTSLLETYQEVGELKRSCEPSQLKKKVARQLGLKRDDLILQVNCIMYFMDGTPCLYSVSYQNTKVLEFETDILK